MSGAELLRAWRRSIGLTLKTAANVVGVSPVSFADWEAGRKTPRTSHAVRLEDLSGGQVTVRSWCGGQG